MPPREGTLVRPAQHPFQFRQSARSAPGGSFGDAAIGIILILPNFIQIPVVNFSGTKTVRENHSARAMSSSCTQYVQKLAEKIFRTKIVHH